MRNINQFNLLHGDEQSETPIEWNIQPLSVSFKSLGPHPKTSPVVSAIMVIPNHRSVDNGDVEVYTSYYSLEYPFDSFPVPYNTPIK